MICTLFSECLAHENQPNFLRSQGHWPHITAYYSLDHLANLTWPGAVVALLLEKSVGTWLWIVTNSIVSVIRTGCSVTSSAWILCSCVVVTNTTTNKPVIAHNNRTPSTVGLHLNLLKQAYQKKVLLRMCQGVWAIFSHKWLITLLFRNRKANCLCNWQSTLLVKAISYCQKLLSYYMYKSHSDT